MDKIEYLIETHTHTVQSIVLADQKAVAFITINSAMVGALYGGGLLILKQSQIIWTIGSTLTFILLIFGTFLATQVLWPRGEDISRNTSAGKLAIPSKIAYRQTEDDFTKGIEKANDLELQEELCSLVYARCKTNDKKYELLKQSIVVSSYGWVCAVLLLVFKSL